MCGKEFCNAYTELNDPFEQRARFEEQVRLVTEYHLLLFQARVFIIRRSKRLPGTTKHKPSTRCLLMREFSCVRFRLSSDLCRDRLEHGLPPTGGWGIGIDRLVMFLTNSTSKFGSAQSS